MGWYLLRTKAGQERRVQAQLSRLNASVLLPLVRSRVRRWGKAVESVGPLFPCYLFAEFDFDRSYNDVRYARGMRELVRFGGEPATVPLWIIEELKQRCRGGPVELSRCLPLPGMRVRVIDGLFRDFEGIFERGVSGSERVAILLSVMGAGARAVLPASLVVPVA